MTCHEIYTCSLLKQASCLKRLDQNSSICYSCVCPKGNKLIMTYLKCPVPVYYVLCDFADKNEADAFLLINTGFLQHKCRKLFNLIKGVLKEGSKTNFVLSLEIPS